MSRSKRKPIIKDRPRNYKKSTRYWRKIRRIWKMEVDSGKEITQAKELENDYNYSDYRFIDCEEKHTRK
jgi:hypothetical protein